MTRPVASALIAWVALMLLLGGEIATALLLPGRNWAVGVLMFFPVVMASVVIVVIMKVRGSAHLVRFASAAGFFWLAILLALTQGDYLTRSRFVTQNWQAGGAAEKIAP